MFSHPEYNNEINANGINADSNILNVLAVAKTLWNNDCCSDDVVDAPTTSVVFVVVVVGDCVIMDGGGDSTLQAALLYL